MARGNGHWLKADAEPNIPMHRLSLIALGAGVSAILVLWTLIVGMLGGESLADAFWPYAVRSLEWTYELRESRLLILPFGTLLIAVSIWNARERGPNISIPVRTLIASAVGTACLLLIGIHLLLDIAYYRGAFILLPMALAFPLAASMIHLLVPRKGAELTRPNLQRILGVLGALFIAWLLLPSSMALTPFVAKPPEMPRAGYGSEAGPYEVTTVTIPLVLDGELRSWFSDRDASRTYVLDVSFPSLPELAPATLPLGIFLHSRNADDPEVFASMTTHLAAKGVVVVHPRCPEFNPWIDFEASDVTDGRLELERHEADHAFQLLVLSTIQTQLIDDPPEEAMDLLEGRTIDPSDLHVSGHSTGGGFVPAVAAKAVERGWGNRTLVLDVEQPYVRPADPTFGGNLSLLPDHTLAHINVAEDDMTVGVCHGVHIAEQIRTRDGTTPLPTGQVLLITTKSDRHGFPPLVASHYLAADPVREALANLTVYPRIDAQGDYLVARSRGDGNTAAWALDHLSKGPFLESLGSWSDGRMLDIRTVHEIPLDSHPSC